SLNAPVSALAAYFATDAVTGHQNGLIGQTTSTGNFPSHPNFRSVVRPNSAGCGSNVHAVSVPSSVGTPSSRRTVRDSSLRVMTSELLQYLLHISAIGGPM